MLISGIFFCIILVLSENFFLNETKTIPPPPPFTLNGRSFRHEKRNNVPQSPTHKIR